MTTYLNYNCYVIHTHSLWKFLHSRHPGIIKEFQQILNLPHIYLCKNQRYSVWTKSRVWTVFSKLKLTSFQCRIFHSCVQTNKIMVGRYFQFTWKYQRPLWLNLCMFSGAWSTWKLVETLFSGFFVVPHQGVDQLWEVDKNIFFVVNFQMFFSDYRREITEKGLKSTKKVENGWKRLKKNCFTSFQVLQYTTYVPKAKNKNSNILEVT